MMERLIDIGARRLGLDPAEIRRRNLVQPGEMPYRPGPHLQGRRHRRLRPGRLPGRRSSARSSCSATRELRARQAAQAPHARGGSAIGVACYVQGTGLGPYEGAHGPRRSERQGLRDHRRGRAGPGPRDDARPDLRGGAGRRLRRRPHRGRRHASSSPSAWAPAAAASRPTPGPPVAHDRARGARPRRSRWPPSCSSARPTTCASRRAAPSSPGVPGRAVTLGRVAHAAIRSKALRKHRRAGPPALHATSTRTP